MNVECRFLQNAASMMTLDGRPIGFVSCVEEGYRFVSSRRLSQPTFVVISSERVDLVRRVIEEMTDESIGAIVGDEPDYVEIAEIGCAS